MAVAWKLIGLLALVLASAGSAWQVQDWRYGRQLAEQARLQASDQTHYRVLSDAQRDQRRLRDRLATADLRLSVLLDSQDGTAGGLVHGAARARLDPAHAQRIVGITDDGDKGLIALAACQAFVHEILR